MVQGYLVNACGAMKTNSRKVPAKLGDERAVGCSAAGMLFIVIKNWP
jgi:hypothetical protein